MHKYDPLQQHLAKLAIRDQSSITRSFKKIETIIGTSLPDSARKHRAWWANRTEDSSQSRAWIKTGWLTKSVDLDAEKVKFARMPLWFNRFEPAHDERQFHWTKFYEAMAKKLLVYREDRGPLVDEVYRIAKNIDGGSIPYNNGLYEAAEQPKDICPFTVLATFNRGLISKNRSVITAEFKDFLGVRSRIPDSFANIPLSSDQDSWFFAYPKYNDKSDIEKMWQVFAAAAELVSSQRLEDKYEFVRAYDAATKIRKVSWNLSMGLYWAHPWDFPTLDRKSRYFITKQLDFTFPNKVLDAKSYLHLRHALKAQFNKGAFPAHSFPELSQYVHSSGDSDPIITYIPYPEIAQGDSDPGVSNRAGPMFVQDANDDAPNKPLHSLFGALAGTVTIHDPTALTRPSGERWAAEVDKP